MNQTGIISDYIRHRWLLLAFVIRDLKSRYAGTVFGMLWSLLHPLMMLTLYTVVFSILLNVKNAPKVGGQKSLIDDAIWICCAILPWIAFQESLQRATSSLVDNANLIKKVAFPSAVVPLHVVISGSINQIPGMLLVITAVAFFKGAFFATLLLLPVIWLLQICFTAGLAWFLSATNVCFRDVGHMVAIFLLVWMFLTPIFYSADLIDANLGNYPLVVKLYNINPMKLVVDLYRNAIFLGTWGPTWKILLLAGYATGAILLGHMVFHKSKDYFADYL